MQRPAVVTQEKKPTVTDAPVLIVDKIGIIGEVLCSKLAKDLFVVFVSQKKITQSIARSSNIVHIAYTRNFPVVPKLQYSYIIVIDSSDLSAKDLLTKFVLKAQEDKAHFIYVASLAQLNEKAIANITNSYQKAKVPRSLAKVVIYGDIFAKDMSFTLRQESIVGKFIWEAKSSGQIKVEHDGLLKTYPVFLDDVRDGILQVAFLASQVNLEDKETLSVFYLFPKHPPTQLRLAHMIHKLNPNVRIDFVNAEKLQALSIPRGGKYLLGDNYDLVKRLKEIDFEKKDQMHNEEINLHLKASKKQKPCVLVLFFYLLAILVAPLILTLSFSFLGFQILENIEKAQESGALISQRDANVSKGFFSLAGKVSKVLIWEADLIGKRNSIESFTKNIFLGEKLSLMFLQLLDAKGYLFAVFGGQSIIPKEDFIKAGIALRKAIVILREIEAEGGISQDLHDKIKSVDTMVRVVENTIDISPILFGFDRKKIYLVLFQNNMELRPSGGFIDSYGLLTVDKGKVKDFSINDVYDADRELRGHVEPPFPIRRHLPSSHWYLRDSNFDADFAKSASTAAFFINVEKGVKVDGVIGIDISFVKKVLNVVGSVHVPDYRKKVTRDNLFEVTQFHAQEKDFLRSLFRAILLSLPERKSLPLFSLSQAIAESINEKHLLFAFADSSTQEIFTLNNWSGWLWDQRVDTEASINDFIGISEANLGVNKVNHLIKRKVSYNVSINEDGKIVGMLTIRYKNTSNRKSLNALDYKNYLRIILPTHTSLLSITIDDVGEPTTPAITDPQVFEAKNFVRPEALEVERTEEGGKTIYGFLVTVAQENLKTVTITYALPPKNVSDATKLLYSLYLVKQPGTDPYPFDFSLSFPPFRNVVSLPLGFTKGGNKVFASQNLLSDIKVSILLARK